MLLYKHRFYQPIFTQFQFLLCSGYKFTIIGYILPLSVTKIAMLVTLKTANFSFKIEHKTSINPDISRFIINTLFLI